MQSFTPPERVDDLTHALLSPQEALRVCTRSVFVEKPGMSDYTVEGLPIMLQQLGHYKILQSIGNGAFAEVFLGEHIYLKRRSAIKVLHPQALAGDKNDFVREAQTAARLSHAHVVLVLEFGIEQQSMPYLVMDYADGGTLRKTCPPGKRLRPAEILPYLQQVVMALSYVHQQQLIHRDIKPANMLLDSRKGVLLSDFGIAALARQASGGTPTYMAPEQIQQNPEAASDQYALAVVVYEWLCGRCPFLPRNPTASIMRQARDVWEQHIQEPPPPLRHFTPELSMEIERVILQALDKDPSRRFAHIEDFYNGFARAVQGQVVLGSPLAAGPDVQPVLSPVGLVSDHSTVEDLATTLPYQRRTALLATAIEQAPTVYPEETLPLVHAPRKVRRPGEILYTHRDLALSDGLPCGPIHALSWSPDGQWLAAGTREHVMFTWHALTGYPVQMHPLHKDHIVSLAWSPDSRFLASGSADQILHVWEKGQDQPVLAYKGHGGSEASLNPACAVCWSPDGSRLASVGADGTLQIWLAATGQRVQVCHGHNQGVNTVCWSPDGHYLATASEDQSVCLWNAHSGTLLRTWHHHCGNVHTLGWSPGEARLASGGEDGWIYLWTPGPVSRPQNQLVYAGHTQVVHALAWSPDGLLVASGGGDQVVHIWDAASCTHRYTYTGHRTPILALVWSPDGRYVASGDEEGMVHVWGSV